MYSTDRGVYRKPQLLANELIVVPASLAPAIGMSVPPPPAPGLAPPPPPPPPGIGLSPVKGPLETLAEKSPEILTLQDLEKLIGSFGATDFESKKWIAKFMGSAEQRANAFRVNSGLSRSERLKEIVIPVDFEKAQLKDVLPQEIIDKLPDFSLFEAEASEKTKLIDEMTEEEFSSFLGQVLIYRDLKVLGRKITLYEWELYAKKLENKMREDTEVLAGQPKNNPIFRDFEKKHKDLIEELQKVEMLLKIVLGGEAKILRQNPDVIDMDQKTLEKFAIKTENLAKEFRLKLDVTRRELDSFIQKMGHLKRSQLLSDSKLETLQGKADPVSIQVEAGLKESIQACERHIKALETREFHLTLERDELTAQVDLLGLISSYCVDKSLAMNAIKRKGLAIPVNPKLAALGVAAAVSEEEKSQLEINQPKYINFSGKDSLYTDDEILAIWFSLRKNMFKENTHGKKLWSFFFDEEYLLETMVEPQEIRKFLKEKVFAAYFKVRLPFIVDLFADKTPRGVLSDVVGGDIIEVFNAPARSKVASVANSSEGPSLGDSDKRSESDADSTNTQGLNQEILAILQSKTEREQRELLDATQRLEELQVRLQQVENEKTQAEALLFQAGEHAKTQQPPKGLTAAEIKAAKRSK